MARFNDRHRKESGMRTSNPAINEKSFQADYTTDLLHEVSTSRSMTIEGTVLKPDILLSLVTIAGGITWPTFAAQSFLAFLLFVGGTIAGLIVAVLTIFKETWAPVTVPIYAVVEGLFLGGISAICYAKFSGTGTQAIRLTLGHFFCC